MAVGTVSKPNQNDVFNTGLGFRSSEEQIPQVIGLNEESTEITELIEAGSSLHTQEVPSSSLGAPTNQISDLR